MIALIQPISSQFLLFFGACSILLLDAFKVDQRRVLILGGIFLCLATLSEIFFSTEGVFYHGMLLNDLYAHIAKVSILVISSVFIFASIDFLPKYNFQPAEYLVMLMFMVVGILIVVSAQNFILLYLGLEIQALSAYTLAAMQRKSSFASEAGVKYFILGSLASVIYLFGASLLYGFSGSLEFEAVSKLIDGAQCSHYAVGAMLVILSFLFKLTIAPFHLWAPDVYQGSPTPATAVFSSILKIGGVFILFRLLVGPFAAIYKLLDFNLVLSVFAAMSLIWGAIVPIFQTSIKRLLAHSAVGHVGFVLLGSIGHNSTGVSAAIFYVLMYAATGIMVFIAFMSLQNQQPTEDSLDDLSLESWKGLASVRPKHAFVIAVGLLSMAGAPPLIGFFPKMLMFQYVLQQGGCFMLSIAVITTVIGLFYYLKLVKMMYIDEPDAYVIQPPNRIRRRLFLVFFPLLLLHIIGGYVPWVQNFYEHSINKGVNAMMLDRSQ